VTCFPLLVIRSLRLRLAQSSFLAGRAGVNGDFKAIEPLLTKTKEETMNNITTTDFSKFGYRERKLAIELLIAWNEQGLPEDFLDDEVIIMMNTHSGNVFLTNADFQVAMMNGDKLESFYTDFETGQEGFKEELTASARARLNLND